MRDRWELGGRKIIGTFRGTLARPTFFEAINAEDRQTERAGIDGKKREERGKKVATRGGKTRSPRNANIRVAGVSTRDVRKRAFEHIVARRALFPPRNAAN